MFLRHLIVASALVIIFGTSIPLSANEGFSTNTDRPGRDYHNFELTGNAEGCREICRQDQNCRAWTYVKPGFQGQLARCWLKNAVPQARANRCCTSGVMGRFD